MIISIKDGIRRIQIYYNSGLIFLVLAVIPIIGKKILLTKINSEMWEHFNITATESKRNTFKCKCNQVVNKPTGAGKNDQIKSERTRRSASRK